MCKFMSVLTGSYEHTQVCSLVCMYMEVRSYLFSIFFEAECLTEHCLGWLPSKSQVPPKPGLLTCSTMTSILVWVLGTVFRSLCLCSKHFTHWVISLSCRTCSNSDSGEMSYAFLSFEACLVYEISTWTSRGTQGILSQNKTKQSKKMA